MEVIDVKDADFYNPESCYHLTRGIHEESINKNGLGADIGIRSKDGVGNEKTNKVFFAKSLEGTLIFINRNLNIFYGVAKQKDFSFIRKALEDDSPDMYEDLFNSMVHDDISKEECEEVGVALGKLYLERGIYYKLNLKSSTKEDFENMTEEEKEEIDYFTNDINEERPSENSSINNMHTRSGRGVPNDKMELMTVDGKKSALDVAISMAEHYKAQNPGKPLPVLEYKNGKKDKPLLEMLVDKTHEKNVSIEDLTKNVLKSSNIRESEFAELERKENITVENKKENEGVSLDD